MSEKRKDIRNKVIWLIKRAKTDARDNVVANRANPPWAERLPAISVRTEDETIDKDSETPRELKRSLTLLVELNDSARTEDELSDKLDDLAEQVEDGLFADDTLGNTANELYLQSVDLDIQPDGEKLTGALKLIFLAVYYQYRPSDRFRQKLVDFDTAHATYQLSDDDDVPQAEDTIDLT